MVCTEDLNAHMHTVIVHKGGAVVQTNVVQTTTFARNAKESVRRIERKFDREKLKKQQPLLSR